jgi:hypothetical protein
MPTDKLAPIDWWDGDAVADSGREVWKLAWAALENLRVNQQWRISEGMAAEQMYEQRNAYGKKSSMGSFGGMFPEGMGSTQLMGLLTYNLMQVYFDTLTSKLLQALPTPVTQTDNGNFETRQEALVLERVIRAGLKATGQEDKAEERITDMLLFGFGAIRWYVCELKKRPKCKRKHPLDLWFDEMEARDGSPKTLYETTVISRKRLAAKYPEFKTDIMRSTVGQVRDLYPLTMRGEEDDVCEVVEAWHLPEEGMPGKWVKFTSACVLDSGDYTESHFPYSFQSWTKRRRGPYPVSAANQVMLLQLTHNKLLRRLHECIHKLAAPRIIYDSSAGIAPSTFRTSGVGDLIPMDMARQPPVIMNPPVVPQDIKEALQQIEMQIASVLGVNALESSGAPPSGIDSAPAMQEFGNQTSLRHFKTLKENERATLQDAKQYMTVLKICAEEYGYKILTEAMGEVEEIDVKELMANLPPDSYKISLAPSNSLSMSPEQRRQQVMEMVQNGLLTPQRGIRALQSPDIMAITSDLTASEKEVEWTIYKMSKNDDVYLEPRATTDLTLGIQLMSDAYNRMRRQKAPEKVLAKFDRWIADAQSKQANYMQMMQAMAQMQMAQQQAAEIQQQPGQPGPVTPPPGGPTGEQQ